MNVEINCSGPKCGADEFCKQILNLPCGKNYNSTIAKSGVNVSLSFCGTFS